ncbi:uncharacterized protein LOC116308005 [Actinia tenebrosa]|uniref:Uncharacterized protein LOC116308005 n=1 Tax=Actinia tenebrosa TaxID=6105 RepID=A0A6P8J3N2_ACTTE|nr:uncharacterized protein LOC116308005 [Actinia tenebrosa]
MNVLKRFLQECGEEREIENIPPPQLDSLLSNFYIKAKKKDNTLYEPDTMSSFSRSIERYLDDKNAKVNILKDEEFKLSRQALMFRRRELRKEGKGNKPNATAPLTSKDIDAIFNENEFGVHDPEILSRTMWFLLTLHFGHRARHEARQLLKFGDVLLKKDEINGEEYVEWFQERETKTRHVDENEHQRAFRPRAYESGDKKYPVACYKQFVYRRPEEAKSPESPFFLAINHRRRPNDQVWFLNGPMGKNKIGEFLSQATKDLKFTKSKAGKITNPSVRKTGITTLLDAGVPHNIVAQLSGHKSLDSYAVASESQQRNMSKILSGVENVKHEASSKQLCLGATDYKFNCRCRFFVWGSKHWSIEHSESCSFRP